MIALKAAGVASALVALLHVAIIFAGGAGYRYFGAGEELARLDEQGSLVPDAITAFLVAIFGTWAAYAFSGAGLLPKLPFRRFCLVAIGVVYTLRGLAIVPEMWRVMAAGLDHLPRHLAFSAVSLAIGLLYLAGTRGAWATLQPGPR